MNLTTKFTDKICEDLSQEKELWNPNLLLKDDWETVIPIETGVSVKIHCHKSNEHYKLDSFVDTVGDINPNYSLVRKVLEETVERIFPVSDIHYMRDLGGISTAFTVRFEDLEDVTTQIKVDLPWGDKPVVVNVPNHIEDESEYAESAVESLIQRDLRTAISEVSVNPRDVSPVARE